MTEEEVKDWIEENGVGDIESFMKYIYEAKGTDYGAIWFSPKGPVTFTKDGKIAWYGNGEDETNH